MVGGSNFQMKSSMVSRRHGGRQRSKHVCTQSLNEVARQKSVCMRLVQNTGNDRVIDLLRDWLVPDSAIDVIDLSKSALNWSSEGRLYW